MFLITMKMSVSLMADQNITTSIDDLMTYLSEHGETESTELSKALGVNESIIETWADVLEKAKITKVSYRVGKMYISLSGAAKTGDETVKKTVEIKTSITDTALQEQMNAVNKQVNAKIDELKQFTNITESAFRKRVGEVKARLDELDKFEAQINRAAKKLKERKDYVDKMAATLNKSIEDLDERSGGVVASGTGGDAKVMIDDIRNKLENADAMIKKLDRDFARTFDENRKGFAELMDGMRKESGALRRELYRKEKENEEYDSVAKSYGRESEHVRRWVSGERGKMLDEIARASQEAQKVYTVSGSQLLGLKADIEIIKKEFGGFADLSDKIKNVKGEISDISKQRDEIAKELGELSLQMRALAALEQEKPAGSSMELEKINSAVNEESVKIGKLNSDMDKVKKDIDDAIV
jgi:chromosome segregation ATPase